MAPWQVCAAAAWGTVRGCAAPACMCLCACRAGAPAPPPPLLAGPVVAAACVVPEHVSIEGIDDSKKMSAEAREAAYEQLTRHPDVVWAA